VGILMAMGPIINDFEFPAWQKLFHDALVELDNAKLPMRVAAAEAAIVRRQQVMSRAGEMTSERRAMEDALHGLDVLRGESIGLCDSPLRLNQTNKDLLPVAAAFRRPTPKSGSVSQRKLRPSRRLARWVINVSCALMHVAVTKKSQTRAASA
jgi:hypothetical protein